MIVQHFYDPRTGTLSYVVADTDARTAVVIDPVLDYDPRSGRVFQDSAEEIARYVDEHDYAIPYVLDTHVHADHLTGLQFFRERYGAKTVIGSGVSRVQRAFAPLFDLDAGFATDGSQFDVLLDDGAKLDVGAFEIEVIETGGHTPASVSYLVGDAVFVGDTLFQPDSGTARCDFPGGSAAELYDSIQRIYALPPETRVFTLHDYQPGGRELAFESTVAEQRGSNVHLRDGVGKQEFVALRAELERGKEAPTLILPSLQVNIRAGHLPEPAANGTRYLKIPLNAFGAEVDR